MQIRRYIHILLCFTTWVIASCSGEDAEPGPATDAASVAEREGGTLDALSPEVDSSVLDASDGCVGCGDSDASSSSARIDLCDGSDEVRLVARRESAGKAERGYVVYQQVPLLVVDGQCTLYMIRDEWSELRSKTLNAAEEQDLKDALHVDEWPRLKGDYCTLAYDAPMALFWVGGSAVREYECFGPTLPEPITWRSVTDYIDAQYGTATAVSGPLWYTLVFDGGEDGLMQYRGGEPWPLEGDPSELSPPPPDEAVPIHRAEGNDAEKLRELRRRVLSGDIGRRQALFIPIVQSDGAQYQLRIRDATPHDGEMGFVINLN
jgi:hypothetical protein